MLSPAKYDVLVIGGLNSDYLIRGANLPQPGETIEGKTLFQGPGGKGANQAVAAARLGARVALIGRVGRDKRGDELLAQLKAESVETRFITRDPKLPTGAAVIMVDQDGEKQIMTAPGANHRLMVRDVLGVMDGAALSRVVLMQFEAPLAVATAAARRAARRGAKVILDPAPPQVLPNDDLLRLLDVIRPNASEAAALTGVRVLNRASARQAARQLLKRGVQSVALQAGEEGDLLVWPDGERLVPRFQVKAVDATGAGDAFVAALALALAEGRPFPEAGAFASAAGALATTKIGAQTALPTRNEVLELVSRIGSKRRDEAPR